MRRTWLCKLLGHRWRITCTTVSAIPLGYEGEYDYVDSMWCDRCGLVRATATAEDPARPLSTYRAAR